jgi:hypothetical protein
MKALKSKLVKEMQQSGVTIPLQEGSKFMFRGKEYIVKYVPPANK